MRRVGSSSAAFAGVLLVVFGALPIHSAVAGTQDGARIAFHAKSHTTKPETICSTWKPRFECIDYNTSWPLGVGADIYMVVVLANQDPGVGAVACGIVYDGRAGSGVDLFGYSLCADFEVPGDGWPAAGGVNRISWDPANNCQRTVIRNSGVHAVACSFYAYAYSADVFMLTGYDPLAHVYDCAGSESQFWVVREFQSTAAVGFEWGYGFNPCLYGGVPVDAMSWGRIKAHYR